MCWPIYPEILTSRPLNNSIVKMDLKKAKIEVKVLVDILENLTRGFSYRRERRDEGDPYEP